MALNDDAFARLVAEDVKNRVTPDQSEYLRLPANQKRWREALAALINNLADQTSTLYAEEHKELSRYDYLGDEAKAVRVEVTAAYDNKRKKIDRFRFHVEERLAEADRLIALGSEGLGEDLKLAGFLTKAIETHRKALELAPNDHLAWSNLGDALRVAERLQESANAYRNAEQLAYDALTINPSDPGLLMDLAWISAMLSKQEEAAKHIGRALELAPDDPYVHYIQGLILAHSGREDEALSAFATAIDKGYSATMLAADPMLTGLRGNRRFQRVTGAENGR